MRRQGHAGVGSRAKQEGVATSRLAIMRKGIVGVFSMTAFVLVIGPTQALAAPPTVVKQSFSGVTTTSATLEGEVNPEEKATEYHFEYGTSDCSTSECTQLPKGKAIVAGTSPVKVDPATLTDLAPHTTYHFRLVANHSKEAAIAGPDATFTTYSLPQVFEPCSNGAARVGHPSGALPDCRAYEQASPVGKNGLDARGRVALVKASADGSAITYGSAGGLADAEGAQDLPTYLASRGSGGWSTQGIFPPQDKGQSVFVLGWTPDLSETFTTASRLGPPEDVSLLMRSSSGGSLKEVVPYGKGLLNPALASQAGFGFAGTSGEGAEVVFESKSKLTPAAQEGAPNVYAWDKSTETLRLAGTLNESSSQGEGKAPSAGSFAGPYDWGAGTNTETLAKGGASAAYYTQDPHAISDNGDVIFTTAGNGQLYSRQNPTQEQSAFTTNGKGEDECSEAAKACTVHISASEKENGKGSENHDAAGTRPAAFLAASKDGSSILFSSSEKLTDDATTGVEPPPAAIGRADLAGTNANTGFCVGPIAKGVAVDGSHIYWVDSGAGEIDRIGLGCEGSKEVLVTGANNPQYVAVDGEHLYWTNAGEEKDGEGTIGRAKLTSGGAGEIDQSFIEGASNPQGVAVQGEFIYWSNSGVVRANQAIGRSRLNGEEVNQAFIKVGEEGPQEERPQGLAVNATHIYMTIDGGFSGELHELVRFDINGNLASEKFFFDKFKHNEVPGVRGIALDASYLYWGRQGEGSIGRIPLADFGTGACEVVSSCEPEFIKEAGAPFGLAADGSHLYWSVNGEIQPNPGNDLYRWQSSAVGGKHLSDLAVDSGDPNGAEVKGILGASEDAKAVYFVANGIPNGTEGSPNANGESATLGNCQGNPNTSVSGQCNLYLAREGRPITFISRLNGADATDWVPRGDLNGQEGRTARVAADASAAIFMSKRQLTAYDNEGISELYRYDAASEEVGCLSCSPTGASPSRAPSLGNITLSTLVPPEFTYTLARNLSADGRRAFFETTEALVAEDTNGEDGCEGEGTSQGTVPSCQDAYEWEAAGEGSCKEDLQGGGCIYLLSGGKSPHASFFADASESGDDAFIATSEAGLVGQDQDQLFDIFDVRKEGGLASQSPPPTSTCEGAERCHGSVGTQPSFQTPSTATFNGPGNPKPKCPKGKQMKKGRCVAKKKPKKHKGKPKKHKRAAGHKGGSSR